MTISYSPRIVTDGLVLCLDAANPKSYPGSGAVWSDLSGNNNDGTLVNGVGYDSANNGSMVFDGVNDLVDLGFFDNTLVADSITLSIWFKADFTNLGFLFGNGGGWDAGGFIMFMYQGGIRFEIQGDGKKACDIPDVDFGSWCNVVGTWDQSDNMKGYLNAVLTSTESGITEIQTNSNTGNLQVGGDTISEIKTSFAVNQQSFVQIYDRALSEAEIKQNFNALRGRYGL